MDHTFVVDSNFFIQAHRSHYPFDVFPSFWDKVKSLALAGKIVCIDKVREELFQNKDTLKEWCESNLSADFFRDSNTCIECYGNIVNWALSRSHHYLPKALEEFLSAEEADAWLIAYALTNNNFIVTHETSDPQRKNKIKIPDACEPFGVKYINTIDLFRLLGEAV